MKFLVDAQLPKTLSDFPVSKGLDSIHTLELPDKNRTKDKDITKMATEEERIIITKDIDFLDAFFVKSEPEKLIIVKTGIIANKQLIDLFEENLEVLLKMISRSNLVEMSGTAIAERE